MQPINETEEQLVRIYNNDELTTTRKIELIKDMAYPDQDDDYAARTACAVCPPPHAREEFVSSLLDGLASVEDGYVKDFDSLTLNEIKELEKGTLENVNGIVLHRTNSSNIQGDFNSAKNSTVGAHFYIDKNGYIYQTANLDKYLWHVGAIRPRCEIEKNCSAEDNATYKKSMIVESVTHKKSKRLVI